MNKAQSMCEYGRWWIEGNPAPMTLNGEFGTGISICRESDA